MSKQFEFEPEGKIATLDIEDLGKYRFRLVEISGSRNFFQSFDGKFGAIEPDANMQITLTLRGIERVE